MLCPADFTMEGPEGGSGKDGRNLYVAPIRGKGLWDAIWAYVSIDEDMIIRGIYFDHKAETPGLGANIKQRFFMDDFIGESLLDNEGNFKGVTVSKTNLDPKNEDKYDNEVDAIAGSIFIFFNVTGTRIPNKPATTIVKTIEIDMINES